MSERSTPSRRIDQAKLLASLPHVWPEDLRPEIRGIVSSSPTKLVVLDDDPTGTQTVYDVPVLTEWSFESLHAEFRSARPCFYVLTNSRSLTAEAARALNTEIACRLQAVSCATGRPFNVVSRSDSTLRGHFPAEADALEEVLGPFDATLLIPYFEAGGRVTIHDVHYVAAGRWLIPVAETPFARDAVFGFRSSNLRQWVEEKTGGRIKAEQVHSISLDELRLGGPALVRSFLKHLPPRSVCVVNAAAPRDLDVLVHAVLAAEVAGKRFVFRTAAQFVAARLGLEERPFLSARELQLGQSLLPHAAGAKATVRDYAAPKRIPLPVHPHRATFQLVQETEDSSSGTRRPGVGGLVVVGSHVPKTTEQLECLVAAAQPLVIELRVNSVLSKRRSHAIVRVAEQLNTALAAGRDVVLMTSRKLVATSASHDALETGRQISAALSEIVRQLQVRPRYLIAKGGITSSDVATLGLGVKRALILGQVLPGVPVWRLGDEAKFPDLTYVVFPGNVGEREALVNVVDRLATASRADASRQ